ncbi:hypothetical protein GP486_002718 [Trichoglossum hirsutum]|uniref:Elongator complex protein 4 n=1 Tax=Trichoglossum hirsutum TaxID=265104 RepID=A0A9P8LEE3_9PEZI|nr:hypothetical protein GP486_002718 [Trichoglossum hirsutum]
MSFRKRNIGLSSSSRTPQSNTTPKTPSPGVRPSPIDGRPTTSTGTPSLDALLAGHAGLALGTSLLVEENGTTDFGGALLRYYAAEGVVQGHRVHVVGVDEGWGRELPGLVGAAEGEELDKVGKGKGSERMKIAWRYERLGEFGGVAGSRGGPPPCDVFALTTHLRESSPDTVHRLVIPTLLSPALYPSHACLPQHLLQFLHALRGLLRRYPSQLTAMITLPLELYPRDTGLVRWVEILSDGVVELTPFPHLADNSPSITTSGAATAQEDQPQGMVKIHSLPIFHERGGGGGALSGLGEDLAFTVSRRKFVIKLFSLPPVEGDTEAQQRKFGGEEDGGQTTVDIDF